MRSFGSDNHSGIHPQILEAIAAANVDHDFAYGDDAITARAKEALQQLFKNDADQGPDVYFVFNGTGANLLSIKTLTRSYNAVICAETAHIHVDECGAPEALTGCTLLTVPTPNGKLTPELVSHHLHGFGFQHHAQPKLISISEPTELGTLYTPDEIRALADLAHRHNMYLHVDGARLANALVALGTTPRKLITETGVDVLSFGGTKNGMMIGEAVLFFRPELSQNAMYERKQLTQLASKMRFIAAQFEAYLRDDLWLKLAAHSNAMAAYMASQIEQIPEVKLSCHPQANGLFAVMPRPAIEELRKEYFFYDWDEERNEVRWMCSFDTTHEDIDQFIAALKRILRHG